MSVIEKNTDRRSEPRYSLISQGELDVKVNEKGKWKQHHTMCKNLSIDGATALSSESIPVGFLVSMDFKVPNSKIDFLIKGRVKWVALVEQMSSVDSLKYQQGIQFEDLSEEAKSAIKDGLIRREFFKELDKQRFLKDRRRQEIELFRRRFDRRTKEFIHEHTIYLSDTNAVGNTYFAKHFEWQGYIREAFLYYIIDSYGDLIKSGVKLITKEASCEYHGESTVYETILMRLRVGEVTHVKVELLFTFRNKNTGKLVSTGRQIIVFTGPKGKPIGIPELVLKGIKKFRRP